MEISRRNFLLGAAAVTASPMAGCLAASSQDASRKFDDRLAVFLSDMHVAMVTPATVAKDAKYANFKRRYDYTRPKLKGVVDGILAMRPMPANVIIFGDLVFDHGEEEDYVEARRLFKPLADAGIKVTFGLGNHDRHETFFKTFPECAAASEVRGKAVFVAETPDVGFVMLDSCLDGGVGGGISDDQYVWLDAFLKKRAKPVFVCSHHPMGEFGKKFRDMVAAKDACAGYIHGHDHHWSADFDFHSGYGNIKRTFRTLSLPSSGFWGDIGHVVMRTEPDCALMTLHQDEFYFNKQPLAVEKVPKSWAEIVRENRNASATFYLHDSRNPS